MTKGEIVVNWERVRELVNGTDYRNIGYRLRVPGGWLFGRAHGGEHEPPVYIPDPRHEWGAEQATEARDDS